MKKPTNEMGVVALFSQYAQGLGYVIMQIQSPFPDATLYEIATGNLVTVEFEFKAKNFKKHGHNPEKCDLIICWENDWAESPIPVLVLKDIHEKEPVETIFDLENRVEQLRQATDEDYFYVQKAKTAVEEAILLRNQLINANEIIMNLERRIATLGKIITDEKGAIINKQKGQVFKDEIKGIFKCRECKFPIGLISADEKGKTYIVVGNGNTRLYKGSVLCHCGAVRKFFSSPLHAYELTKARS